MKNSQRVLIVISDLTSRKNDFPMFDFLYKNLEVKSVEYANQILGSFYEKIKILSGAEATFNNFINILKTSALNTIEEIDVLLHLHGISNKYLYFHSNDSKPSIGIAEVRDRIKELKIEKQLRMLYSSACFGAAHAKEFVEAGFTCASGAIGINTSTTEYKDFLKNWASGNSYRKSLTEAENSILDDFSDTAARLVLQGYVNSKKLMFGKINATINSD